MEDSREDFADQLGRYLVRVGFTQQELANKIGMHRNTIVKWMNRTSWPTSRGQVLRTADELSLSKPERKAFIQAAGFSLERWPTEVWTVPVPRDMFFTGRDDVIQSLRELLVPGTTTALTQAISGPGGIGKTHTAVEYAYRFYQDYEAVLWLQADSWETLVSACVMLADELELPKQEETDQVIAEVQRWLRKHPHWLLILDGVEDPQEILTKFVPTGHRGSILITTRVHDVEPLAQTQVLTPMSEQEGVLFLLRRTKRIASRAVLNQASPENYNEARLVWQLMDGLPLALDQAGAYILETGCSFSEYREQYARRRAELLHRRGKRFLGHEASVSTTFSLAFERVKVLNPLAADILQACSLLHNEGIPEEIFQEGSEHLGPRIVTGRDNWDLAIGVLQDYSLVQHSADTKTLTIHRLVQVVLLDSMSEREQKEWNNRITAAVCAVLPKVEQATWNQYERLLPQARACATNIEQWDMAFPEASLLLNATGRYLLQRAQYSEAEPFLQRSLTISQRLWGKGHPEIAGSFNSLAGLYYKQGKYELAEPLYQEALAIHEQSQGSEHPALIVDLGMLAELYRAQSKYEQAELLYQRIAEILSKPEFEHPDADIMLKIFHNRALLYQSQGKYEQAEPLYRGALEIAEQLLGPEHPDTAQFIGGLANLYELRGKYEQAELLHQRSLTLTERLQGPEHPDTALSLVGLANLYESQGKDEQAEPLYRRALAIYEQVLGPEHPDTALSVNNLAFLYQKQGNNEQAGPLYQRALAIRERVLGPEHPDTAQSINNLAEFYTRDGKDEQAEPLLLRALAIRERVLDPEHPDIVASLVNLAALYKRQGKNGQAELLLQRALAISKSGLGLEHLITALSFYLLADFYSDTDKEEEAEPLYQQALAIREKVLGLDHPTIVEILNKLAQLYQNRGKDEQAEPLLLRALAIREQALGPEHPDVVESLNNLGAFYKRQGKNEQAGLLLQRALMISERVQGREHPNTALILHNLANLYADEGKEGEAEPLLQRALRIYEQKLGGEHLRTASGLSDLARLYAQQDKFEQAEPIYRRALMIFEQKLGSTHPDIAQTLNNLAELYERQGKDEQSESFYRRALAIREKALGLEHADTAQSFNNLAEFYDNNGEYERAEPLYLQSLAIRERVLGSEHPETAKSFNNLAGIYESQGKVELAESFYKRALAIDERVLGPDHPDTAQTLSNLAALYHRKGDRRKAEPLYQQALAIREKALGPEHPSTLKSLHNLANLYHELGEYERAEPLYLRVLSIREQSLGLAHLDTARTLNNLTALYRSQGKYEQAEQHSRRELAVRERVLGPDHPDLEKNLDNLAVLSEEQEKYEQAETFYLRILTIKERSLGPEHIDVAKNLNNLALLYFKQGKYDQAEPLFQRVRYIREHTLGEEHLQVAYSLNNLAFLYSEQGKYDQAEPLLKRVLAVSEKVLGPEHSGTADILSNLAGLYEKQGKYEQAEPLYRQALTIHEQALGPEHTHTIRSLRNLAEFYLNQDKYEQAEPLLERVLKNSERVPGPDHPEAASDLKSYAILLWQMGRENEALNSVRRALTLDARHEVEELSDETVARYAIADLLIQRGKVQAAMALYERILQSYQGLGDVGRVAMVQANFCQLLLQRREYPPALSIAWGAFISLSQNNFLQKAQIMQQLLMSIKERVQDPVQFDLLWKQVISEPQPDWLRDMELGSSNKGHLSPQALHTVVSNTIAVMTVMRERRDEWYHTAMEALKQAQSINRSQEAEFLTAILAVLDEQESVLPEGHPYADALEAVQTNVALGRSQEREPPFVAPAELMQAFQNFIQAEGWNAKHQVLEAQQALLFQEQVETIFELNIQHARAIGYQQWVEELEQYLTILRDCKRNGIGETFKQITAAVDESLIIDAELIHQSVMALLGSEQEKISFAELLTSLISQTTSEELKIFFAKIQQALSGDDLSQMGRDLQGIYRQAWETIVTNVEMMRLFGLIAHNTLAVLGSAASQRGEWRSSLAEMRNQATAESDHHLVALLDSVIGLLDADGNPNGKGGGLIGIYARTWQAIVQQLPHNQDTPS